MYTKTINFGALPNTTTKSVAHNINYEWMVVDYKSSYAYETVSGTTVSVMNGNYFRIYVSGQNISCSSTLNVSGTEAIVVLRYTKTTDTAESPVRLVGPQIGDVLSATPINQIVENIKINGEPMDMNGNIQISGTSTMCSPEVGIEKLTEYRDPSSGKPFYIQTIITPTPNNTTKVLDITTVIPSVEYATIIEDQSYAIYDTRRYGVNMRTPATGSNIDLMCVLKSITIGTLTDWLSVPLYITLKYTKTTDNALSPVRLVGNTDYIISPNGTKYKINVDNDGNLSTTQII